MARVEMISPASSGTVMVPEAQVKAYKANGWRTTEAPKPKRESTPEPKQGKRSTKKSD